MVCEVIIVCEVWVYGKCSSCLRFCEVGVYDMLSRWLSFP